MKITNAYNLIQPERPQQQSSAKSNVITNSAAQERIKPSSSEVELSKVGRYLQQARTADSNDVDMDRVNALREAISNGSFEVNSHRIADSVITSAREFLK